MKRTMQFAILALTAMTAGAQMRDNQKKDLECRNQDSNRGNRDSRFCEIREMPGAAVGRLAVEPGRNGSVSVKGWSRNDVLVRSKVEAWANTEPEAQSLASQVRVSINGGKVMGDGPSGLRDQNWSVSFEIFVPQRTDLELSAHNGSIHLQDLNGDLQFKTTNGSVHLARLAGRVHGTTTNGSVHAEMTGSRWEGTEFDVQTTNGSVHLQMPQSYSARLEASTNNGRIHADMPGMNVDRETRQVASTLGSGGPLVRAITSNGTVHIGRE